ncbi:MAG: flagellar basal body-associated FliL family protein [Methylococcales bacterium]|nr:flagellar basal body-associated FliL family protein [Methylococcaceae bacterium]
MRIIVLMLSLLLLPFIATANSGGEKKEEGSGPVIEYLEMTPKFTVNLNEPRKYLMVNVQILVEGAEAVAKIKKHMPALRHELIMLYTGRASDQLQTMEQREALRKETFETIHKTLDRLENSDGLRDVFFTEILVD